MAEKQSQYYSNYPATASMKTPTKPDKYNEEA